MLHYAYDTIYNMSSHMENLRITLETGLPVMQNKKSGHGQGSAVTQISDEFTEYALNLVTTNIVLLVERDIGGMGWMKTEDNLKFEISVPTDNEGFVLLKCPICMNLFKLKPSVASQSFFNLCEIC